MDDEQLTAPIEAIVSPASSAMIQDAPAPAMDAILGVLQRMERLMENQQKPGIIRKCNRRYLPWKEFLCLTRRVDNSLWFRTDGVRITAPIGELLEKDRALLFGGNLISTGRDLWAIKLDLQTLMLINWADCWSGWMSRSHSVSPTLPFKIFSWENKKRISNLVSIRAMYWWACADKDSKGEAKWGVGKVHKLLPKHGSFWRSRWGSPENHSWPSNGAVAKSHVCPFSCQWCQRSDFHWGYAKGSQLSKQVMQLN